MGPVVDFLGDRRMTQEPSHPGFRLSKWYMDCVGADGETLIAYFARVGWRGVSIAYAGLIRRAAAGDVASSFSLRPEAEPRHEGDSIAWECGDLDIRGEWRPRLGAISRTLLQPEGGRVEWHCIAPAAAATIDWPHGTLRGLGYIERIDMTIAPSRLPIRELRWGRFIGPRRNVVWIDWRGEHPLTLIVRDGIEVAGRVEDLAVHTSAGEELTFRRDGMIRSGRLGATVLASIPGLRSLLPEAILGTQEDKWVGRGVLRSADGSTEEGWAIHETVRFGREPE